MIAVEQWLANDLSKVVLGMALLAPGVLINFFRNTFVTGRHPKIAERTLELLFVSSVYYAIIGPAFITIGLLDWYSIAVVRFALPAIIGVFLGLAAQKRWFDRVFELLGMNPLHPATTGWDFMFGTMKTSQWIVVTLRDGTKIRGWFSRDSGASTDLSRRDIFIADVRREDFTPFEDDGRNRGIWLHEDEIRHIEIVGD